MFKKIIAIALAVVLAMSVAAISVSAANTNDSAAGADSSSSASGAGGNYIYFDANGWKNFSTIYCHIYKIGGDSFFGWQTGDEKCEKDKGTVYKYDLSKVSMQSGGQYAVLFSADTGIQTYDTTIGSECKGDTLYLSGKQIENPVDSKKKGDEAKWTSNSGKYGPHLALTSIGNVVGDKLAPGETGIQVIGEWAPKYFNSQYCKPVDVLAKAYPKFGIKTIDDLTKAYAVAKEKVENGDISLVDSKDLPKILKVMQDAFYKAYPSQKGKKVDTKAADDIAKKLKSGQTTVTDLGSGSGSGGTSSTGTTTTGGGSSSSGGSSDSSGSSADGQETTIFFILGGVMIAALGAMFISRKKREE